LSKLIVFLLLLIAALQYRLWLGDGGIEEYRDTTRRIDELQQEGEKRKVRNAAVAADVIDLRDGSDAVEERARNDLGMVKPGETYVQVYDEETVTPVIASTPETTLKRPKPPTKEHQKAKKSVGKTSASIKH
jgi:cell division protein FtsB